MLKRLLLASAVLLPMVAHAAETQCRTTCNWNQCFTRCAEVYSEQEIYNRNQGAAERNLDYRSSERNYDAGSRARFNNACTRALESGVDNDTMTSYGCRN